MGELYELLCHRGRLRFSKWIPLIRFGQNLSGTYYMTWQRPPLRKSVITWKSIQVRDPFFPRSMFSRVRNAMKLSFALYDNSNFSKIQNVRGRHYHHSNYLKIQNGRHSGQNWCFETQHLFTKRYTLVGAMKWRLILISSLTFHPFNVFFC